MTHARTRFWFYLKAILAILSAAATVLVMWRPDWIEVVLGFDPDKNSGALEIVIPVALATATLLLSSAAWRQRQRVRAFPATGRGQGA